MKKLLYLPLFLVFIFSGLASAQQKVRDNTLRRSGALPVKDALLELESTNKGLLHTRVQLKSLTDAAPLYFNDGTKWVLAASGNLETLTTLVENTDEEGAPLVVDISNLETPRCHCGYTGVCHRKAGHLTG